MNFRQLVKRIVRPNHYCNDAYVAFLRKGGAKIGEGTHFYGPEKHPVDESSLPWIRIGDNCRITTGAVILAHDYSYAVVRPIYHVMPEKTSGVTSIGNNVFVGMNSIILPGVTIGDNVVVGAGSVVTKDIPSNTVVGGNPARVLCSLEEYYNKLMKNFEKSAVEYYIGLSRYYNRPLKEKEMSYYITLWKSNCTEEVVRKIKVHGDDQEDMIKDILKCKPRYQSFEEFKLSNSLQ